MHNKVTKSRKIDSKEVEALYTFTRQHYVEYYDLQTELVDHLANGMEKRWLTQPHLSFEENLQLEFKKFGVIGFADVIKAHQKAITKRYYRIIGRVLLKQLLQPKYIFALTLATGISFLMMQSIYSLIGLCTLLLAIYIGIISYSVKNRIAFQKRRKKRAKVYLLEELLTNIGGMGTLIAFPVYFINIPGYHQILHEPLQAFGLAIFTVLCLFVFYTTTFILPKRKEKILNKIYPERKLWN